MSAAVYLARESPGRRIRRDSVRGASRAKCRGRGGGTSDGLGRTSTPTLARMIWYAVYGSNVSLARFRLYLEGGAPVEGARAHNQCRAGSTIAGVRPVMIDRDLYFAGHPDQWNGGVAFVGLAGVDPPPTYGRAYRLTSQQLLHVASEENGGRQVRFNPGQIGDDVVELGARGWYRLLLPLGMLDGEPVVTLTGQRTELGVQTTPSPAYQDRIRSGLSETYPELTDAQIDAYLNDRIVLSR